MKRRIGVFAALTRWRVQITYYLPGSEEFKRFLRQDVQAIETELRCTFSDEQLEHIANCASFTRQYMQADTSRTDQTRADFISEAEALKDRVHQINVTRHLQRIREQRRRRL